MVFIPLFPGHACAGSNRQIDEIAPFASPLRVDPPFRLITINIILQNLSTPFSAETKGTRRAMLQVKIVYRS
jgi:hypothetical protein